MTPRFSLPLEQLRALLEQTISAAPSLGFQVALTAEDERWLARAETLIEASGSLPDLVDFRVARGNLGGYSHSRERIMAPLLNAYERVELHSPATGQGRFIPPGETWNGYAALVKIIQPPSADLLIIDRYLNGGIFIDLMPQTNASNLVRCLTVKGQYSGGLEAAAHKWQADNIAAKHPVEVRCAPDNSLHDRAIIVDMTDVWLVSQSLKDIGAKSPATVTKADTELAGLKMAHYDALWHASAKLA